MKIIEKTIKNYENHQKNNKNAIKTNKNYENHWENNKNAIKTNEKQWKSLEKAIASQWNY